MKRPYGFAFGILLAASVVFLSAQVGGFPSRPRFFSVGVGIVAPSAVGEVSLQTDINSSHSLTIDNDSNGTANLSRTAISSGDVNLSVYVTGSGRTTSAVTGGPIGAQAGVRTLGAHPLIFGTGNTYRGEISSAGEWISTGVGSGGLGASFEATNTLPQINFIETDGPVDETAWGFLAEAGTLVFRATDDSGTPVTNFFTVNRTGTTVDSIALAATSVTINGAAVIGNIVCTTACAVTSMPIGGTALVLKTTATARSSTVTPTLDPDLQFTSVPVGRYIIETHWLMNLTTTTTQGFRFNMGSSNHVAAGMCQMASAAFPSTALTAAAISGTDMALPSTAFAAAGTNTSMSCQGAGTISTSAGTIGVLWAQSVSNANASNMQANSWIRITRIT